MAMGTSKTYLYSKDELLYEWPVYTLNKRRTRAPKVVEMKIDLQNSHEILT